MGWFSFENHNIITLTPQYSFSAITYGMFRHLWKLFIIIIIFTGYAIESTTENILARHMHQMH